jgi:PAS domain S-box-containing protein
LRGAKYGCSILYAAEFESSHAGEIGMTARARARAVFLAAIGLLFISGIATYFSFSYLTQSESWVSHTQEVRAAVGDVEAALNEAGRARVTYLLSGDATDLRQYQKSIKGIQSQVEKLCQLTTDNPVQVGNCAKLRQLAVDRLAAWQHAIDDKQQGKPIDFVSLIRQNIELADQYGAVSTAIRAEEGGLLMKRTYQAQRHFALTGLVLMVSFIVALLLLTTYYRLLTDELRARENAEIVARNAYEREVSLRQLQERFRLFVEAVKDYAIYTLDAEGRVTTWNQGAERIHGYPAAEVLGKSFSILFTEEDRAAAKPQEELETAAREGHFEGEAWRARKDGTRFWANVVLTSIKDQQGKVVGFSKVMRDFTERMLAQEHLRQANVKLADEVIERKAAEAKLASSEASLRELSLNLLRTQDEERRRIGRELHDSLGQYLAVLKLNLQSVESGLGSNHDGTGDQVAQCVRLAEDCIKEVRTISYLLYPPMLEEVGLKSAISWYLDGFSKRSNIEATFHQGTDFGRLPRDVELALFRVLQESLTNVHRHSKSPRVEISMAQSDGRVTLQVKDEGQGIPIKLLEEEGSKDWLGSSGVGLRGMSERMRQIGGELEVASNEQGTIVTASVPTASAQVKIAG